MKQAPPTPFPPKSDITKPFLRRTHAILPYPPFRRGTPKETLAAQNVNTQKQSNRANMLPSRRRAAWVLALTLLGACNLQGPRNRGKQNADDEQGPSSQWPVVAPTVFADTLSKERGKSLMDKITQRIRPQQSSMRKGGAQCLGGSENPQKAHVCLVVEVARLRCPQSGVAALQDRRPSLFAVDGEAIESGIVSMYSFLRMVGMSRPRDGRNPNVNNVESSAKTFVFVGLGVDRGVDQGVVRGSRENVVPEALRSPSIQVPPGEAFATTAAFVALHNASAWILESHYGCSREPIEAFDASAVRAQYADAYRSLNESATAFGDGPDSSFLKRVYDPHAAQKRLAQLHAWVDAPPGLDPMHAAFGDEHGLWCGTASEWDAVSQATDDDNLQDNTFSQDNTAYTMLVKGYRRAYFMSSVDNADGSR